MRSTGKSYTAGLFGLSVFLSGGVCTSTPPTPPPDEARVGVVFQVARPLYRSMLRMTFFDAWRRWSLDGAVLENTRTGQIPGSIEFPTATSGKLEVHFRLSTEDDQVASEGDLTLSLKPDWAWGLSFVTTDEADPCTTDSCFGFKEFPLDAAFRRPGGGRLFVLWGGNSIKHPVIY